MKMLANKLNQAIEAPLTSGPSPDHHSESKLLSDAEMHTDTSPQEVETALPDDSPGAYSPDHNLQFTYSNRQLTRRP